MLEFNEIQTCDEKQYVLSAMLKSGGGWYPLSSAWRLENNQRTNRVCKELAGLGLVDCVGGDPGGPFVCDWRINMCGVNAAYRHLA